MTIQCPRCKARLKVSDASGPPAQIRCGKCGHAFSTARPQDPPPAPSSLDELQEQAAARRDAGEPIRVQGFYKWSEEMLRHTERMRNDLTLIAFCFKAAIVGLFLTVVFTILKFIVIYFKGANP